MAYNTLTEREAFYCLCHVPGFGSATIGKLRERFGTYQEVWTAKEQEIQKAGVLTEKRVTVFLQAREQESAWLKEFYGLERTGIRFIAEGDTDYPERFLPYKDRPAALFVKGNLPENEVPAVAIVGARACTEYGKEAAGFYAGGTLPMRESTLSAAWRREWMAVPTGARSSAGNPPTRFWDAG